MPGYSTDAGLVNCRPAGFKLTHCLTHCPTNLSVCRSGSRMLILRGITTCDLMAMLPKVALVGAGPGDPGLLTLRGRELLERADVVIYDHLANPVLLDYALPEAERLYVGKRSRQDPRYQEDINALLLEKARAGKRVVRLKGGDPFIFGRGGEEAEALRAAGIPYEVVPGITAGYAVPAYAGIPITNREVTSTVAFVTGHADPETEESTVRWDQLATAAGTLVLYMAWANLAAIARKLIQCGRPPETPVAVICWGTTPLQQIVTGTLVDIAARVAERGLKPPTITVVGEVVSLRDTLAWFERLPLFGRRIVVTRARHQAAALAWGLRERGALAIELPTIELRDPKNFAPLDQAVRELESYDWLVFTSANGVEKFFARLEVAGRDARAIRGGVCAIGPATAEQLRGHGVRADRIAAEYRAEGVLAVLTGTATAEAASPSQPLTGQRILIPRAAVARDLLPRELEACGARVDVVEAYRTVGAEIPPPVLRGLAEEGADFITFTSSSTVENCPAELRTIPAASIGPITTETARCLGFQVVVEAREYTAEGLLAALEAYFAPERQ